MALVPPAPGSPLRGLPEDCEVVEPGIANRAARHAEQHLLEMHDRVHLREAAGRQTRLQERERRPPLFRRHLLDRHALAFPGHEIPVQTLLGVESNARLRAHCGIEGRKKGRGRLCHRGRRLRRLRGKGAAGQDRRAEGKKDTTDHRSAPSVYISAQVLQPGVGHQRDHRGIRPQPLRHFHRGDDIRSGRRPREERLLSRDAPRHLLRVVRPDRHDLVHESRVPEWRSEANPDSLDLVRTCRTSQQYRGFRGFDGDDPDTRFISLQSGGDSARGSRRADAMDEGVDLSLRLDPDLLAQRVVARDAVLVMELVRPVGVRLPAQLTGGLDHVQDQFPGGRASLALDERQLRAQRRHVIQFLLAERIGGDDLQAVALCGADQCQRCPRAATRVLDDGIAGLQPAVRLRPRDHDLRHPVLHAAGGVLPLELHEDLRATGWNDLAKPSDRRISNGLKNIHGLSLSSDYAATGLTAKYPFPPRIER